MNRFVIALRAVLVWAALAWATPAAADLHIRDGALVEADGLPFVMRGVNVHHAWASEHTERSLADIAATGANTVRLVLSSGQRWRKNEPAEVARLIALAKRFGLILILEPHDTTGYGADGSAAHLGSAIGYWAELAPVLRGQEDYVLINIGNEPTVGADNAALWFEGHAAAIQALRYLGLRHTIVVDAHDYGQDSSNTMRDRARALFECDPYRNMLFSVHMYQVYGDGDRVRGYIGAFQQARLPLIVGEFGPDHMGEPVDEDAIFDEAQRVNLGWLAWSWSGNSAPTSDLDMVHAFDGARLTPWGERVINGSNGIRATARRARIFSPGPRARR